nr:MAG TPA: hypothetical protein [Caudoviricetes sp.]
MLLSLRFLRVRSHVLTVLRLIYRQNCIKKVP